MALTKNREELLVLLDEQQELKKRVPSSSWALIGCLIEAEYNRMEADNDDSAELTEEDEDPVTLVLRQSATPGRMWPRAPFVRLD